jgi:hypothetical protein
MANKTLTKKREEQAELQKVRTVRVCLELEATENTLQRLNALMMLSDPAKQLPSLEEIYADPLPFDAKPTTANPLPLELDYNAIRKDIRKHLTAYTEKFGTAAARTTLSRYGAKDGKPVPDGDHLLDLLAEIEAAIA